MRSLRNLQIATSFWEINMVFWKQNRGYVIEWKRRRVKVQRIFTV